MRSTPGFNSILSSFQKLSEKLNLLNINKKNLSLVSNDHKDIYGCFLLSFMVIFSDKVIFVAI